MNIKYIKIKVTPKSRISGVTKVLEDGTIKVAVKSAPQNNRANREVFEVLAKHFKIDKAGIKILAGHTSSTKLIKISTKDNNGPKTADQPKS